MGGGKHSFFDTEGVMDDFGDGSDAVGGARGVGNNGLAMRGVVIDAQYDGRSFFSFFEWSGEDDFLGAGVNMNGEIFFFGKAAGGLDDDIDIEVFPR